MIRILYVIGVLAKYFTIFLLIKFSLYRKKKPKLFKAFFEEMGGSFIKFGQLLAMRVDVLPKAYSLEMLDLLDNFSPFPYKDVEQIFLNELGAEPDKMFTEFEKVPFASASFGQVHAAKLNKGEIVAVKIMRPGIEERVVIDFFFVDVLALIGDTFFKIEAMPWKEFATEFKNWTLKELDYYIEAAQIEKMYRWTQDNKYVVIPKVYTRLSTKRILVEEYIDGIPLSRVLRGLKDGRLDDKALKKIGIDIKKTPRTLVYEIMRQYFYHGIYHADPHPGNILLLPNNKIALIDFGIVGVADPEHKQDYIRTLMHIANYELRDSIHYFAKITGTRIRQIFESAFPATLDPKFTEDFMGLLSDHFGNLISEKFEKGRRDLGAMKTDYAAFSMQIFKTAEIYKVRLPKHMIAFLRALSMLGFLAKQLDYDFKLTSEIKFFFERNPPENFKEDGNISYEKRINREKAMELLNNWLAYIFEKRPELYKLVNDYIARYNTTSTKTHGKIS